MPVEKMGISLPPTTYEQLMARVGSDERSGHLARSLDRYFSILQAERRRLRDCLSDAEIALICAALNGAWLGDQANVRLIWASVQDAIELDSKDAYHGVEDGTALVAKLRGFGYVRLVALADAVEVWWQRVAGGEQPAPTVAEVLGN